MYTIIKSEYQMLLLGKILYIEKKFVILRVNI